MKYLWVIDAGHGGVDAKGNYTTDPIKNKKYTFEDGHTVLEGVINRGISQKVEAHLAARKIPFRRSYDAVQDWPLDARVKLINGLARENEGKSVVFLVSIHSNAGKGKGFEIFTSKGQTPSDPGAEIFCQIYKSRFPQYPFRADKSDGDNDKEADYTILKKTTCRALLVENLFFDNREEADYLESEAGQAAIAGTIVQAIEEVQKRLPV